MDGGGVSLRCRGPYKVMRGWGCVDGGGVTEV